MSVCAGGFPRHVFNHHSDCHTRGEAVRVEQYVRDQTRLCERQILSRPLLGADALLTGAGSELVTHCRITLEQYNVFSTGARITSLRGLSRALRKLF